MSVSIEQYRARIGSHANFIKHRELESHLKNKFWNTMLMLFYMNVFYLPTLKRLLLQRQNNHETVVWLVKTLCYYHVYVPLLLRLSNDVETNPGPTVYDIVNPTATVCADFSQGDRRFGFSAGKQCVAMSLIAIVYNQLQNVSTWNSSSLNTILLNGNSLYIYISNSIRKDFLLLTEVPEMISLSNNIYTLQYSEPYAGSVFMTVSNEPFMTLEDALKKIFLASQLDYTYALLTIGCNTVAILKISEVYKVFDSHSRDPYGMPHSFGKCVLLTILSIPDLVTYFQSISAQAGGNLPYEIKGVSISFNASEEMDVDKSPSPNEKEQPPSKHKQATKNQPNMSSVCSGKKLTKTQKYYRQRLQNETPEQREKRLSRQREYKRKQRANQSSESRTEKSRQRRQYEKQRIQHETPEKRDDRLSKLRRQRTQQLQNETPEKRIERLTKLKQHKTQVLQNETPEQRDFRLLKLKQYNLQILQNEIPEERNKRLSQLRQHITQVRRDETPEEKQGILSKRRECYKRSRKSQNPEMDPVGDLVAKFHKDVSDGPLFICTCCSQLWYKHSVCLAERTRLSNPNMIKHLQNIISIDKKEWICRSCNEYLKKNKVPPCAITNGMKFPEKPNF